MIDLKNKKIIGLAIITIIIFIVSIFLYKQKSSNAAGLGVTPKKAESVTPKMLAVTPVTPILSQVLQGVVRL